MAHGRVEIDGIAFLEDESTLSLIRIFRGMVRAIARQSEDKFRLRTAAFQGSEKRHVAEGRI